MRSSHPCPFLLYYRSYTIISFDRCITFERTYKDNSIFSHSLGVSAVTICTLSTLWQALKCHKWCRGYVFLRAHDYFVSVLNTIRKIQIRPHRIQIRLLLYEKNKYCLFYRAHSRHQLYLDENCNQKIIISRWLADVFTSK